jgi:hypothetical protein
MLDGANWQTDYMKPVQIKVDSNQPLDTRQCAQSR